MKTQVLWVGQQNKYLNIRLEGKKLRQQYSFVYLGGAVCGDGGTETEIRKLGECMEENGRGDLR